MPPIDNPLKILILTFEQAFTEWLLGQPVQQVRPLNVELPATGVRSDLIFEVIQTDGQPVLLHIELQGPRTQEPMPWRMLDYMSRLVRRELGKQLPDRAVKLHSVVIYTGVGAGVHDTGQYEVFGLENTASLSWRYQTLLLWQMEAEEILKLGHPAFLPLVGQSRLREPERVLPEVLAKIRQVENVEQRGRLLTALTSLMNDEEALEMVEGIIDMTDELLNTPYLRRIRHQGHEEGLAEGKELGLAEGLAEGKVLGLAEGKELGLLEGLREAILEAITVRFNPLAVEYRQVSRQLTQLTRREQLQNLLTTALQAGTMAEFTAQLQEVVREGGKDYGI